MDLSVQGTSIGAVPVSKEVVVDTSVIGELNERWTEKFFLVQDAFRRFDEAATGTVTFDEFCSVLRHFQFRTTTSSLRKLANKYVSVGDRVDYGKFVGQIAQGLGQKRPRSSRKKRRPRRSKKVRVLTVLENRIRAQMFPEFHALQKILRNMDKDKSGIIHRTELQAALEAAGLTDLTLEEVDNIVTSYGGQDGCIRYADIQARVCVVNATSIFFLMFYFLYSLPTLAYKSKMCFSHNDWKIFGCFAIEAHFICE